MRIIGVAACDSKYGIGYENSIPWLGKPYAKVDLARFKQITSKGNNPAVLMGRKTYQSIGKVLPNRINIIISKSIKVNHAQIYPSIEQAINDSIKCKVDNLYVIGGATIYNWFAKRQLYTEFHLTKINNSNYTCDVNIMDTVKIIEKTAESLNIEIIDNVLRINKFIFSENTEDNKFKDLLSRLLNAPLINNRTNYKSHTLCNQHLTFSLLNGILPATTLRRQWLSGIFWELQWFLNGRTDLKYLHDKNIHIWDANYEASKDILNLSHLDVGKIYGYQWRNFSGTGFDQISYIMDELRNNPCSRRIMLSGWCPPEIFNEACLPPCHVCYNFNVVNNKLYCQILQRSSDVALALSWNIISGAFLTHMIAHSCGLEATELAITICNAHIYENHKEAVNIMLTRNPRQFPRIEFKNKKTNIWDYTWDDFTIYNYVPHPNIDVGDMAV